MAVMNLVDPHPVHVDQGFNVSSVANSSVSKRPICGGSGCLSMALPPNNPAHGGIASQTVGVVHIVIAAKAPEKRTGETDPSCRAIRSCR